MKKIAWFFLSVCAVMAIMPLNVFAVDEEFYSGNDILFYNGSICSDSETSIPTSSTSASGEMYTTSISNPQNKQYHGDDYSPRNSGLRVGDDGYSKQNSVEGIKYARNKGYKSIDLDLNKSTDGIYFAAHNGGVVGKTWAQINNYNSTRKFKIYQLSDLLHAADQYNIQANIELKIWGGDADKAVWTRADIIEIATLANNSGAKVTIKGNGDNKNISDALHIAQEHGFWVRTVLDTGRGNDWEPREWYPPSSTTQPSGQTSQAPRGRVKVGQANIKVSSSAASFKNELNKVIATNPDFISGNEWSSRSNNQIKRTGYDFHRGSNEGNPARKTNGNVVMWKNDKWTKVAAGTVVMTRDGDVNYNASNSAAKNYDGKRSMVWVTLKDNSGGQVSFMSTHHMVNPNKFGPRSERKALYKLGLERAIVKVKELQGIGPVIIAGDFNAQKSDNGPWHPRQMFGDIGMESTHDSLPNVASYVDWIFYTKRDVKPVSHAVPFNLYDHPYLTAKLEFYGDLTYDGVATSSASGQVDCVCKASGSSSPNTALTGRDNLEKIFNYFIEKGLSKEAAAGIIGNISQESGGDPQNVQNGTSDAERYGERTKDPSPLSAGWGIIQWTPGSKIIGIAREVGITTPIYELSTQLDIVWWHMNNTSPTGRSNILPEFKARSTSPKEAAIAFEELMEGAGRPMMENRIKAADKAFSEFGGGATAATAGVSGGSGNNCGESGDGSNAAALCSNVDIAPPNDFEVVTYQGERVDKRTLHMIKLADDCLKQAGLPEIIVTQGGYCSPNCASASGSSHNKGGTIDISIRELNGMGEINTLVKILREVGFAAWYRDTQDGMAVGNEHIHANTLGAPETGPNALGSPGQIVAYCDGRAGAYDSSAKDRHLSTIGRPLPAWAEKYCTRYP